MTESSLSVRDAMRRAVGWAVTSGVLSFAVASLSPAFAAVVGIGAAVTWLLGAGADRVAPRRAINAGLIGVIGFGIVQTLRLGFTVDAFAFFIGLIMVVKLLDLRVARDWGQVITLSAALVISAVLTNNSIGTGIAMLVSAVLLLRAVLRFQVFAACERAGTDGRQPTPEGFRRSLGRLQWGIGSSIMVLATVIFVLLPRDLGSEAFGSWGNAAVGQTTGFADEVELGQPGLISQSPTPVMDVSVVDRHGRNLGAVDGAPIYLRGAVLEGYNAGRWTSDASRERRSSFVRSQFIPEGVPIKPWLVPGGIEWETELRITMRNARSGGTPLFTAWEPLELTPLGSGRMIAFDPSVGLVFCEQTRGRLEYRVRVSNPEFRMIPYPEDQIRRPPPETDIPAGVVSLAQRVLQGAGIDPDPQTRPLRQDVAAVRAMESYLRSNFAYTLEDQPTPPGRDATEWFLDERRVGHCEYFASALALMCRSVGIDARVITGYVVSDFNEVTGQYIVRESSAHAWIEAQVSPGAWLTFDATPRAEFRQIHQPDPSLWRSITKLYETVEYAWVAGVVGFDSNSRRQVLGPMSSDFGLLRIGSRMIGRLRDGGPPLVLKAAWVGLAVFCGAMFAGFVLHHRREWMRAIWDAILARFVGWFARLRAWHAGPEERLRMALLTAFRCVGRPKPGHVPMRAHIESVAADIDEGRAQVWRSAADLLYAARFSRDATTDPRDYRSAEADLLRSEKRSRRARPPSR
ncbi:MAG: DUF3488 domain-containing protein [Planctomycetota bacterium]|nr:MAG: DUF3488 domain-containing protein [Planctomycetota bacterium]